MYKAEDFADVNSHEALSGHVSTGFGPAGERGTSEHAANVADALAYADEDVFAYYGNGDGGFAEEAALHANVCSLQSAAGYAREVMLALADYPTLLAQVEDAIRERKASAGPRP